VRSGAESWQELRHRALDRKPTKVKGRCRHSRHIGYDIPIKRPRFYQNFDPSEGESKVRLSEGDIVVAHEVRQGSVVAYLNEGDYTGEGCFLVRDETFRYTANVTAMVDSDLCFLHKSELEKLAGDFPEIQTCIQTVLDERETAERPRRMFASAAHGDNTLDKKDLRKLLQDDMFFTEDTEMLDELIKTVMSAMDTDGTLTL
jgi:hypothetical protein